MPHQSDGLLVPPDYTVPINTSLYTPLRPIDTNPPIIAPVRLGQKSGLTDPILTDTVYISTSLAPSPNALNFTQIPQSFYQSDYGGHYQHGKIDSINCCYVDGHVDRHFAKEIKVRFGSQNAWVCR